MKKDPFINVEKIIRGKNPRLLKWMPKFLLNYVKRILHEKDVNNFMELHGHNRNLDFVNAILTDFKTKIVVKGIENIPEHGGVIIASNHPLGGFDGLALIKAVSEKRLDIRFLVNDILLNLSPLNDFFVPVNKHGAQNAISKIEETYKSDNAILVFPAGLVSRKQKGKIMDLEWKKSFIAKSIQYHKPIVPTFIDGKNSSFFYNFSLWRKRLGIKANLEMFYLSEETFKQRHKTITITFGEVVHPSIFDPKKSHRELAEQMKTHIYAMGEGKIGPFSKPKENSL